MAAPSPLRVVVGGAEGRMGRLARSALDMCSDLEFAGGLSRGADPACLLSADVADVYLDLTVASAARVLAPAAARAGVCPVVGTSGLTDEDLARLGQACVEGGVGGLVIPNFSVGAVLQMVAAEQIARHLTCTGITEVHHSGKRDSPSGTARATAHQIGQAARTDPPQITSERRDDALAEQTVTFASRHERLVVHHAVSDRQAYVPGLLLALRRVRSCTGLVRGLAALLD